VLRTTNLLAALLAALVLAACGGDDNDNDNGPDRAETPSAQTCPPEADQALKDAEFAMKSDDFDAALAAIKPYLDCPKVKQAETGFRDTAAKTTLRIARKHLETATKKPSPENSPQAAVSLARNSLRYKETPEAQELLAKAEAELAQFKEKYGPRPDEEPGGPPAGAGDGGPPEGKGDEE
jgi:outer membrane PBP1 activator LpoA protein